MFLNVNDCWFVPMCFAANALKTPLNTIEFAAIVN